jgi:uncharacterized protein
MIKHLSSDEARAVLTAGNVGRLGCVLGDGSPYVIPVNYVASGERIHVHSLPGREIQAMRLRPRICLQVDDTDNEHNWRSAIAFGIYEEITEGQERDRAVADLLVRFPNLTPVESGPVCDRQGSVVVFAIRVTSVSGVCEAFHTASRPVLKAELVKRASS